MAKFILHVVADRSGWQVLPTQTANKLMKCTHYILLLLHVCTTLDSQASLLMLDVQGHRAHAVRTKALFRYENFLIKMSH
jgi:hypothetical protein